MKNYTQFSARFWHHVNASKLGLTESFHEKEDDWIKRTKEGLFRCKIFEITDNMRTLLTLTNPPEKNDFIHLPFPVIFIDVNFTKEELHKLGVEIPYTQIIGILVSERNVIVDGTGKELVSPVRLAPNANPEKDGIPILVGRCLSFEVFVFEIEKGKRYDTFKSFSTNYDLLPEFEGKVEGRSPWMDNKTKRFLQGFVLNVLNTLYDPDITYVLTETDDKRNQKRMSKGKQSIPGRLIIKVKGQLKIYLEKINKMGISHYTHRFWVRGHYRTLKNERYGENVGRRIWIVPYVKGDGILINRKYEIGGNKNDI